MEMVTIKLNGMPCSVPAGSTILEAARYAGIEIPTLCYLKEINEMRAGRICVVEVKGARSLVASCVYPVNEGMEVLTNSPKVLKSRIKQTLETDSLHAQAGMPVLCPERELRASKNSAVTIRLRIPIISKARIRSMKSTIPQFICTVTTTSASSAAAVSPPAAPTSPSASSAPTSVGSILILHAHSSSRSVPLPASPAAVYRRLPDRRPFGKG